MGMHFRKHIEALEVLRAVEGSIAMVVIAGEISGLAGIGHRQLIEHGVVGVVEAAAG